MPTEDYNLGERLTGLGAWWSGKGPAWEIAQARKQESDLLQDQERKEAMVLDMRGALMLGNQGRFGEMQGLLQNRLDNITQIGGDPTHTASLLRLVQGGQHDEAMKELTDWDARAVASGALDPIGGSPDLQFGSGQQRYVDENNNMFYGTTKRDKRTGSFESVMAPIGHDSPREGKLTPVNDLGLTPAQQVAHKGQEAGAVTEAKLTTEFKLKPGVEAEVKRVVGNMNAQMAAAGEERSNEKALAAYESAMSGLSEALAADYTGPGIHYLTALTTNAQISAGAIAAFAPIMKNIFRAAGEGVFTKDDQDRLMDMLPTRADKPAARIWKLKNVDALVRYQLSTPPAVNIPGGQAPGGQAPGGGIDDPLGLRGPR